MGECCWSNCAEEATVTAEGYEGAERFVIQVCGRHWLALREQEEPWHLVTE